jgi:lipopolysaccharide biosynthesis glycosyltransferase
VWHFGSKEKGAQMTVVPIVHCFDGNYVVPAAVAFHSLLSHAKSPDTLYVLHVIGRDLSDDDRTVLQNVVGQFHNAKLVFHSPPHLGFELKTKGNLSVDVFYKLAVPDLIDDDVALIADVDVVYEGDVADLYHEIRGEDDFWLCGTADVGYAAWRGEGILRDVGELKFFKRYLKRMNAENRSKLIMGAGFFAMNLKRCRADGATEKWFAYAVENIDRLLLLEQDVLNICSWSKIKIVSSRYMAIAAYMPRYEKMTNEERCKNPAWDDMYANPVQIHYTSGVKPWKYPASPMAGKWFDACVSAKMLHRWREWHGKLMSQQTRFSLSRKIINLTFKIGRRCFRIVVAREKTRR